MTAELLSTQVDLSGLLKVLGRNLYSTPSVAIRELVQNAHDSCNRRHIEAQEADLEPSIRVYPSPTKRTLTIVDTGAGLTRDEVVRYLATVGRGYTGKLRDEGASEALIGYFGLGFLSAFFVSDRVELETTSFQAPEEGWRFSSRGGERYSLEPIEPRAVGTRVVLYLSEAFKALAEPEVVASLLHRYCSLLDLPVYLSDDTQAVNRPIPPWREAALPVMRRRALEMDFAARFETRFQTLCTLPVEPSADSDVRGLLWVQDGWSYGTSDNRNLSVFVRGMLVSDDARELLPAWAGFVGGVIESTELVPTASREDLQRDATYETAALAVKEALVGGLARLAKEAPSAWRRVLARHNEALLGAALCDDRLLDLLSETLRVPTSEGDLPLETVARRGRGRVHVSIGEGGGYEEVLFRATRVPVVVGTRYGAFGFSEAWCRRHGSELVRLGTRESNASLFAPVDVDDPTREALTALFGSEGREVVPTRFEPDFVPVVLVPDREARLKRRLEQDEADRRITAGVLGLARLYTDRIEASAPSRLYVNLDASLVTRLLEVSGPRRDAVALVVSAFADLMTDRREADDDAADAPAALRALSQALDRLLEG